MMEIVLKVENLSKSFGSVRALQEVSFELGRNKILGLVGDNGAGKSTLLKILNGYLQPDSGNIYLDGEPVSFSSPRDAQAAGIAMTYQTLALVESASAWENFFLNREKVKSYGPIKILQKAQMKSDLEENLLKYGIEKLDPEIEVRHLSGGQRQILSITRSIESDPEVLLLDEPLTELSREDRNSVVEFIQNLREKTSTSIIIVSHDLEIIRKLVDNILVLNKGEKTLIGSPDQISTNQIVEQMV